MFTDDSPHRFLQDKQESHILPCFTNVNSDKNNNNYYYWIIGLLYNNNYIGLLIYHQNSRSYITLSVIIIIITNLFIEGSLIRALFYK